jgi:hypothetical protein
MQDLTYSLWVGGTLNLLIDARPNLFLKSERDLKPTYRMQDLTYSLRMGGTLSLLIDARPIPFLRSGCNILTLLLLPSDLVMFSFMLSFRLHCLMMGKSTHSKGDIPKRLKWGWTQLPPSPKLLIFGEAPRIGNPKPCKSLLQ